MKLRFFDDISELNRHIHSLSEKEIFFVTESNCKDACLKKLTLALNSDQTFLFNAGESNKNSETFLSGIAHLADQHASRNTLLINIGGGVTTDLGGFLASTYKRGVPFINIPTSLLAMVDASIGGKVGINHGGLKNYIGNFSDPDEVLICADFLETLPNNELISGFAEVLKHGLIKDKSYWEQWKNVDPTKLDNDQWLSIIKQSCSIKMDVVNRDPKESGERKILNFGHTIGHSIESLRLKQGKEVKHGEAVAAGMMCESFLSQKCLQLNADDFNDIVSHLTLRYGRLSLSQGDIDQIMELIRFDKKNEATAMKFSLLSSIGSCETDIEASAKEVRESLLFYTNVS